MCILLLVDYEIATYKFSFIEKPFRNFIYFELILQGVPVVLLGSLQVISLNSRLAQPPETLI